MCIHIFEQIAMIHELTLIPTHMSWAESQKGISAVHRCSIENQKGTNAIDFVQQQCPSGSQWNIFEQNYCLSVSQLMMFKLSPQVCVPSKYMSLKSVNDKN